MKNNNKKLLATILFAAAMSGTTSHATAADSLISAFNDIKTSAVDPGVYKSKTRTTISGGSFSARVPTTSFTLISYTPPSISAGCNGIDAHFGGFSFVNGVDYQKLVENIMQNALGLVINLAIKVGCEPCQNILQQISKAIRDITNLTIDSCMAASSAIEALNSGGMLCTAMSTVSAKIGASSDEAEAQTRCNDEINSYNTYQDLYKKDTSTGSDHVTPPDQLCTREAINNKAWCVLLNTGVVPLDPSKTGAKTPYLLTGMASQPSLLRKRGFAELLMNMMPNSSKIANPNLDKIEDGVSTSSSKTQMIVDLFKLASCGAADPKTTTAADPSYPSIKHRAQVSALLKNQCEATWKSSKDKKIYICNETELTECGTTIEKEYSKWAIERKFFSDGGMYGVIADQLIEMYTRVENRQKFAPEHMALIQAAPLPLYQLINLSASFPAIRYSTLETSTMMLADILVDQYFKEQISLISRKLQLKNINPEDLKDLRTAIDSFAQAIHNASPTKEESNAQMARDAVIQKLAINIEQYKKVLLSDISSSQIGANLQTTSALGQAGTKQ